MMMGEKKWFYGIEGVEFLWHGEWADPTLVYRDEEFNYYDIEDTFWSIYKEECEEGNKTADEDEFARWMKENGEYVRGYMDDIMMVEV